MKVQKFAEIAKEETSHEGIFCQRFLKYGEVDHLSNFSQATIPAGQSVPAHRHESMTEVFHVLSGKGEMIIDGVVMPIEAGSNICIKVGQSHELKAHEDLTILYFGVLA